MLRKLASAILVILVTNSVGLRQHELAVFGQGQSKPITKARHFACPMHPDVTSNKPGKCPKCGMRLREIQANDGSQAKPTPPTNAVGGDEPAVTQIPDEQVYDQNGNPHNFYSDLVKGKTVAINFIFTTCTGVCPPMTATLRRVQENLPARNPAIQLISISVDPETDTPPRLREFAAKFHAGPGWTFVTGERADIDLILRALGAAVANKNDHTPMILIGNEQAHYWTRVYGLSSPAVLVEALTKAADSPH